jgi:diguanylate cyclase (GGDEF)-like protein
LDWFYNPTEKAVLSFQKELVEKIAHSQDIEWIANLNHFNAQHFHHSATSWQKQARELGITSFLGVPIVFKGNVLAVLIFLSDCSADQKEGASVPTSSPSWLKLIRSVASQLGTLMQRLYTETALKEANEKLQYLVAYDGLTKIANRRRFDEYLDEQWRQGKRDRGELSLILCDLDAFKLYNDHFGHQAGDQCLQAVAEAVQKVVKRPLDLVARYGGEELAVLLPYTAQIGAFQLAEKIREAVKALQIPHPNSPVSYCVTVSVGVSSIIPREDSAPKNLIRMADEALYQAKNQGRDRVVLNNQLKEDCLKEI